MPRFSRIVVLATALSCLASPASTQDTQTPPPATGDAQPQRLGTLDTDEARVFLQAFQMISRYHSSALEDSTLWERAIEGLIEQLDDPYATVFTPAEYGEFREDNTGDYAGIGVQITQLEGRVTITAVFRETPADRVGMAVGDRIVWVEGEDASEWSIDDARDAIRGEPGSVVDIKVARDGYEEPIPMSIERDNVHVSAVAATWIDDDVAHISIDRVARGVAEELAQALTEYSDARAVIIDLRRNPGGYLDESLRMADLFLEPGQTLASADARNRQGNLDRQAWQARSPAAIPDTPIIILVDRFTASAAEIVTGALQDYDRAVVLGERTFGKGVVQTVYPLHADRQLRITTGAWYTPLGRSLHRERNRNGTLKAEDPESRTTVSTPGGRALESGGGIFPDLAVADDTLRAEERALLNHANQAQVPLAVRIEEYAFEMAKAALESGTVSPAPPSAFDDLANALVADGMEADVVQNPVARAYLEWRTQVRYLTRAEARGAALMVQAERDRVLSEALRLSNSASTPAELFAQIATDAAEKPGG